MLRRLKVVPGIQVFRVEQARLWGSRGYSIVFSEDNGDHWRTLAEVPTGRLACLLCRIGPLRRLLRLGIRHIHRLSSGTLLIFADRCIFRLPPGDAAIELTHRLQNGRAPLPYGIADLPDGSVIFGEYWANPDREPVRLIASHDDGRTWQIYHEFGAGFIRHVHAVQWDSYTKYLWVAAGDRDEECCLMYMDGTQPSFTIVGSGSQDWRAVSLVFEEKYIYWGSDRGYDRSARGYLTRQAPEDNRLFRLERSTGSLEGLTRVGPPVYFGTRYRDRLIFTTAVEGPWREWKRDVCVWASVDGEDWEILFRASKDWWPFLFEYGRLQPAQGDGEYLWMSAQSLRGRQGAWAFALDESGPPE